MNDTLALALRVFAAALFDWSLAAVCGLQFAAFWLRGTEVALPLRIVRWPSVWMALALVAQFYLVVASMTGQFGVAYVLSATPLVAGTHAGSVTLYTLIAATALLVAGLLPRPDSTANRIVCAALAALILALHAATGHAASDAANGYAGSFSLAELLQFLHLSAMALWTGGVLIAAFVVLPRFPASATTGHRAYLHTLSNACACAVGVVLLTGAWKGWTGLDRQLGGLVHTGWGRILLVKLAFVAVALALGLLHRIQLARRNQLWTATQARGFLTTLRMEAFCLSLVVLLSAWLGSVDPAGM